MDCKLRIGVLIYTYNRTDDAAINMEIIRNTWILNDFFEDVKIVHSFNGDMKWWPEKHLEDHLVYSENSGHYSGAAKLLDEGFRIFQDNYPDITHVIVLASDTWLVKPDYLEKVLIAMHQGNKVIATCGWGTAVGDTFRWLDMAVDFFIVNLPWVKEKNLFPLNYQNFYDKYAEYLLYQNHSVYLEQLFLLRVKQALLKNTTLASENLFNAVFHQNIFLLKDREPVNIFPQGLRNMHCEQIGLLSHHDPVEKKKDLAKHKVYLGIEGTKFFASLDLSYFNNGHTYNIFEKDGVKIAVN